MGLTIATTVVCAQTLPSTADINRIVPTNERDRLPVPDSQAIEQTESPVINAPEGAENLVIRLNTLTLKGVTVFSDNALADLYQPYIGQDITLDNIWKIANAITDRYRNAGYFLSRAYVPEQQVDDGNVVIAVVEGYISNIVMESALVEQKVMQQYIQGLLEKKPLKARELESFMLRLDDLPGTSFFGALEPDDSHEGAAILVLHPTLEATTAALSFDNYGSRFLGPYQGTASMSASIIPLQETGIYSSVSLPTDELYYVGGYHKMPLAPKWEAEASATYVASHPGAGLESSDIDSDALDIALALHYQLIRQRQENLRLSLKAAARNSNTDIFSDTPLTRDRIRTLELAFDYETSDSWHGYNNLIFSVTRGLDVFGASEKGESTLSRQDGVPDFTKTAFSFSRQQFIGQDWLLVGKLTGQYAFDALLSSEEFGYGGRRYGRAYDPSELTGDHGLSGSAEVLYTELPVWQDVTFTPYSFYDIGKIWNKDTGPTLHSASSAGVGVITTHANGLSVNLGVAWPLTKPVDYPISGNDKNPRFLIQTAYRF